MGGRIVRFDTRRYAARVQTKSARTIHRGDVFWIAPDALRAPEASYAHPHVVVQDDVFNHSRIPTVVVCALTTNLAKANEPGNVLLDPGEGNLPKQSVVVVSQIDSVEKARLEARDQAQQALVARSDGGHRR